MSNPINDLNSLRDKIKSAPMWKKAINLLRLATVFMACLYGFTVSDSAVYSALFFLGAFLSGLLLCIYVYIYSFWNRG